MINQQTHGIYLHEILAGSWIQVKNDPLTQPIRVVFIFQLISMSSFRMPWWPATCNFSLERNSSILLFVFLRAKFTLDED